MKLKPANMATLLAMASNQIGEPIVKGECSDCGEVFEIGKDLATAGAVIENHMKTCKGTGGDDGRRQRLG